MEGYNNPYQIRRYKESKESFHVNMAGDSQRWGNDLPEESVIVAARPTLALSMSPWNIPQILESLFKQAKVHELTIFRLVNRNWNSSACIFLRAKSYVNLVGKSEGDHQVFWEIYQRSLESNLASPLKNFAISMQIVPTEMIRNILCSPDAKIISLSYSTHQNITHYSRHFKILYEILQLHGETLRTFHYTFSHLDPTSNLECGWRSSDLNLPPLCLPALEEFNFFIWSYKSIHKQQSFCQFMYEILASAPNLKKFCTNSDDHCFLNAILNLPTMKALQDLYLTKLTPALLPSLQMNVSRNLRSLGLTLPANCMQRGLICLGQQDSVVGILHKVRRTIEELAISNSLCANTAFTFPVLPKIETLLLHEALIDTLKIFTPELAPNLKSIYIANVALNANKTTAEQRYEYLQTEAHPGVEEIVMKFSLNSNNNDLDGKTLSKSEHEVILLCAFLCRQYPQIKTLKLFISTFSKPLLRSVIRFFPQLKHLSLELLGHCNIPEDIFTGVKSNELRRRLTHPELIQQPRTKLCLLDLKQLKTLVLTAPGDVENFRPYLTENSVVYGIQDMDSLEEFQFDWHENMFSRVVIKNLDHLQLTLMVPTGMKIGEAELQKLQNKPNIRILHKSIEGANSHYTAGKFDFRNYSTCHWDF